MHDDQTRWWMAPPGMSPEGPFSLSEMRSRVESAPRGTDWQVCKEGSVEWHPIFLLPGFTGPSAPGTTPPGPRAAPSPAESSGDLVLLHLSQFGSYILPFGGLIAPLVIWQMKKDENDLIDRQGREIINWQIFQAIGLLVSGILVLVLIGIPMLIVLVILGIVFPVIGAVKGSKGEFHRYPMPFRLLGEG